MPYAEGRTYCDADGHVMEPKDWLVDYVEPDLRDKVKDAFDFPFDKELAAEQLALRAADPAKKARSEDRLLAKAFFAHGAFDGTERSEALDLLGFDAQLVFQTFTLAQFIWTRDLELAYGGTRAHNRAITEWCSGDERLFATAYVPMRDPERDIAVLDEALALGAKAVLLPTFYTDERGPTHGDYEPLWARLAEAEVPFATHVGTGGRLIERGYRNNGRPVPVDIHGGGENIRSKDFIGIHHWPEYFLSMLALDGVFARHPGLRGGSMEQGAVWVPSMLHNLDACQDAFKHEPDVAALPEKASDYLRRQVKFTPFYQEDVGWLTEQLGPEMLLFSSDFPHMEGGRDPVKRFEVGLDAIGADEATKDRFYSRNFLDLFGLDAPPVRASVAA